MKKPQPRSRAALRSTAEPHPVPREPDDGKESGPVAVSLDTPRQKEAFEAAAALFHTGQFQPAQELFRQAAQGPNREMAHTALLHARMCERRLAAVELTPRSAEEHYNIAVALINQRRLEPAERHLRQALAQTPDSDHLYYVLSLCYGLGGDLAGAYDHLKRAIELRPQNRIAARNDPDFAEIGRQPPLAELLYPERADSG